MKKLRVYIITYLKIIKLLIPDSNSINNNQIKSVIPKDIHFRRMFNINEVDFNGVNNISDGVLRTIENARDVKKMKPKLFTKINDEFESYGQKRFSIIKNKSFTSKMFNI